MGHTPSPFRAPVSPSPTAPQPPPNRPPTADTCPTTACPPASHRCCGPPSLRPPAPLPLRRIAAPSVTERLIRGHNAEHRSGSGAVRPTNGPRPPLHYNRRPHKSARRTDAQAHKHERARPRFGDRKYPKHEHPKAVAGMCSGTAEQPSTPSVRRWSWGWGCAVLTSVRWMAIRPCWRAGGGGQLRVLAHPRPTDRPTDRPPKMSGRSFRENVKFVKGPRNGRPIGRVLGRGDGACVGHAAMARSPSAGQTPSGGGGGELLRGASPPSDPPKVPVPRAPPLTCRTMPRTEGLPPFQSPCLPASVPVRPSSAPPPHAHGHPQGVP